jgi:hypothetical protein
MLDYFAMLRRNLFPTGPLLVILDTYAAHRSANVREAAKNLQIDLIFIPPGCTDRLQPLDRRVFGALKGYARRIWREHYHKTFGERVTRPMIAESLITSWQSVAANVTESAWAIFHDGWGEELDSEEPKETMNDPEYQQLITIHDLLDL